MGHTMLLEKFFGQVTGIFRTPSEAVEDGQSLCSAFYAESKPMDSYPEAVQYIEKVSSHPYFHYATIEKRFITEEKYKELLEQEEMELPEVVE